MPERVYMEVDGRRDHSFPIPRPERKETLHSPNACQSCHEGRDADWATRKITSWRSEDDVRRPHWTDALIANSAGRAGGEDWIEIAKDASLNSIVRANAWARLAEEGTMRVPVALLRERLKDASDLERMAMIEVMRLVSPAARVSLLRPLLEDDRLAIRIEAGLVMAELATSNLRPVDRSSLARALREYRAAQGVNAERPEAQVNLGLLSVQVSELESARAAYERALELAPYFVPAYANLADLERMLGDDEAAVEWLQVALTWAPDEALIHYARGLALHRLGSAEEALVALTRAARTEPRQARFILAWSLALDASGRRSESVEGLAQAIGAGHADANLFHALVTMQRDEGEIEQARQWAEQWLAAWPSDTRAHAILQELEGRR
jgi:tetratricopeptide (TPR) repeat protein